MPITPPVMLDQLIYFIAGGLAANASLGQAIGRNDTLTDIEKQELFATKTLELALAVKAASDAVP